MFSIFKRNNKPAPPKPIKPIKPVQTIMYHFKFCVRYNLSKGKPREIGPILLTIPATSEEDAKNKLDQHVKNKLTIVLIED